VKQSNQHYSTLLLSAKIAPRMHRNAQCSTQTSKNSPSAPQHFLRIFFINQSAFHNGGYLRGVGSSFSVKSVQPVSVYLREALIMPVDERRGSACRYDCILVAIIRPHRLHAMCRCSLLLSVLLCTCANCVKTAERIEMPFGGRLV